MGVTEMDWSCRAMIHPSNLCGSSRPGTPQHHLTPFLHSSSYENCPYSHIPFWCHEGSAIWPHPDLVNFEMYLEAKIKWDGRCTWSPCVWEIGGEYSDSWSGGAQPGGSRSWGGQPWGSWLGGCRLVGGTNRKQRHNLFVTFQLCECRELSTSRSAKKWGEGLARRRRWSTTGWCKYLLYAVLGVNSWSWHGEIERDDITSCSLVMVELRTREWEMRGDGGNNLDTLGLKRTSCVSQFTIPNTVSMSSDLASDSTDTWSSPPNQTYHTRNFSFPPGSSTSFGSSSPSLSFLSTTVLSLQNTKSSHPLLSLHDMIMSWHRVEHTLSTAPTLDCLCSLQSHDYVLTPECSLSFWHAFLCDKLPSGSTPC